MSTIKETMTVIAQGPGEKKICPIVDEIAGRMAGFLEEAAEFDFGNDEDVLIRNLLLRLYLKGAYWEAIDLLSLSFSLVEMDEAAELVSLLGSCTMGDAGKDFLELFLDRFGIRPVPYSGSALIRSLS